MKKYTIGYILLICLSQNALCQNLPISPDEFKQIVSGNTNGFTEIAFVAFIKPPYDCINKLSGRVSYKNIHDCNKTRNTEALMSENMTSRCTRVNQSIDMSLLSSIQAMVPDAFRNEDQKPNLEVTATTAEYLCRAWVRNQPAE